jgi:hypothetical protein
MGCSRSFWRRFARNNTILVAVAGLFWVLLRSGPRPSRLAYPCQQAALGAASLGLGIPLVSAVVTLWQGLRQGLRVRAGVVLAVAGIGGAAALAAHLAVAPPLRVDPPADYRAQVFHVEECPQDPVGDSFPGLDNLLTLMASQGVKLYRSEHTMPLAGPEGIIAAEDVVVLKINYQWEARGGTNTDLLRGVIRHIVDHPDGFTGEIVICENTQSVSIASFDRAANNAQDFSQSPRDVVEDFQVEGWQVSLFSWTAIRYVDVEEFSAGDDRDGYVVSEYDSRVGGRLSYPKFRSSSGTPLSLRYGIWNPRSGEYDRERLRVINLPVLKSHGASYGATACVKNYMGLVTNELMTNSHAAIANGILGAVMARIGPPDLNILDCIWINAHPQDGPWCSYGAATRRDELVASTDPVAADIWAVTSILIPGFYDNGYVPPWPKPDATPDDPSSDFRRYLDSSMSHLLAAGYQVTNDLDQIDLYSWNGRTVLGAVRTSTGRVRP